jgi:hypothetical protein
MIVVRFHTTSVVRLSNQKPLVIGLAEEEAAGV